MSLYHFTDARNIPSIKEHGLHSWWRLLGKKIDFIPASTYNSRKIDRDKELQNYVRLCKDPNHPMAYIAKEEGRIGYYKWLEIDESVLNWNNTLFSDLNACSNSATVDGDRSTFMESDDRQAEVLVHGSLNLNWISFP
jgi:hypothetical protein